MRDTEETERKPLPDYNALKKEAESMNLKVKAYYEGKLEINERRVTFSEDAGNHSLSEPQLPLVHLHSQRALRKRIVLDGLNRV